MSRTNSACIICGGEGGAHVEFLGRPCPAGSGVLSRMKDEELKRSAEYVKEQMEVQELEALLALPSPRRITWERMK